MELSNGIIKLRSYEERDIDPLYEAAKESYKEVFPWLSWCHENYQKEEAAGWITLTKKHWEDKTAYEFVILDSLGYYVGGVGLNQIRNEYKIANLGYWVRTKARGQGYAPLATRLIARWGFEELGLNRIEIVVGTGNLASQRVAEKAGATREGTQRNRIVLHGKTINAVMFSFIPEDFQD